MISKRNVIIGLVILAIAGLIGNYFFPEEDKSAPSGFTAPIEKAPVAKKVKKAPPAHNDIEGIAPYTVAEIHKIIGDREKTIERILYRARWNLESNPANREYIDRNVKMRNRYKNSIDEKLLSAITMVAIYDHSVGYNAGHGGYVR